MGTTGETIQASQASQSYLHYKAVPILDEMESILLGYKLQLADHTDTL
jgi:hypothetical protein